MHEYELVIDDRVASRFPGLKARLVYINDVVVVRSSEELEVFKNEVYKEIRASYTLDNIKMDPVFRAYRDFYWRLGLDPTKTRPASEALVRRIVSGRELPRINTLVEAYNLASAKSKVPLAAFDADALAGSTLRMRFAKPGEEFLGIGMDKPRRLSGHEVVVEDSRGLVAIYPYRDAERTKVTEKTRRVLLMVCGAPGVPDEVLDLAERLAVDYIRRYCSLTNT